MNLRKTINCLRRNLENGIVNQWLQDVALLLIHVARIVYVALDKSHLAKTAILDDYESHPSNLVFGKQVEAKFSRLYESVQERLVDDE